MKRNLFISVSLMFMGCFLLSCEKNEPTGGGETPPATSDYAPGEIPGLGNAEGELTGTPYLLPEGVELLQELEGGGYWTDYFSPLWDYAAAPQRKALARKALPEKTPSKVAANEDIVYRGSGTGYVDILVNLANNNSSATVVEFPAGLILENVSGNCQNGVLLKKVKVEIPAGGTVRICLSFYCGNLSRSSAHGGDVYTWGVVTDAAPIIELCNLLKNKKINIEEYNPTSQVDYNYYDYIVDDLQSIVWKITDSTYGLNDSDREYINSLPNEGEPTPGTGTGDDPGTGDEPGEWIEDGNQLIYEVDEGLYLARWVLTFDDNGICIESKCEMVFTDALIAQLMYDELLNSGQSVTISENTVIVDFTEYHAGLTKEDVLAAIGL